MVGHGRLLALQISRASLEKHNTEIEFQMALRHRIALGLRIRQKRKISLQSKGGKLHVSFGPPALLVVREGLFLYPPLIGWRELPKNFR